MSKRIISILLVFLMLFTTPVFSQNINDKETKSQKTREVKQPVFSPWAKFDINDAIYMGLIENSNLIGLDFRKDATIDFAKKIYKNAAEKLEKKGISISKDFNFNLLTREETLKSIATLLNLKNDPIKALQEEKIFKGNGKNIDKNYLNKKISFEEFLSLYQRAVNQEIQKNNKASKGFYYEITNGENKIHLLGSIHLSNEEMYPIREEVINDFLNSSELILELDGENIQKVSQIAAKNNIRTKGKLSDDLGMNLYNRVKKILEPYGITEEALQKLTVQSVYSSISIDPQRAAREAGFGIDFYFLNLASLYGKNVSGLETAELQANILKGDNLDKNVYIKLIEDSVTEIEKNSFKNMNKTIDIMQQAWMNGDLEKLNEVEQSSNSKDETDPMKKYNENLFGDRDKKMAEKLSILLNSKEKKEAFVVIGAYHTTLDTSARSELEKMGFNVVKK